MILLQFQNRRSEPMSFPWTVRETPPSSWWQQLTRSVFHQRERIDSVDAMTTQ